MLDVCGLLSFVFFFFSSRRRHTRCALVTGVQTCALPIYEPTIGTGGYARQSLSQDDTDWLTRGELNGERFLETRAVIFVPTGDGFDKEITRPVIVNHATLTEGQFVFSVGSSLPAAVTLLPTTPEEERTFKYRIYAR